MLIKIFQLLLVLFAVASVALADIFIKKASHMTDSFWDAIRSPYILVAIILYFIQIIIFTYVFVKNWQLGIIGILQGVFYAIIVIFSGIFFFKESVSLVQALGMAVALTGAVMMNISSS